MAGAIKTIDLNMVEEPSRFMCSYFCPCEEQFAQPWLDLDEETVNKHKRTKSKPTQGRNFDYQDNMGRYRFKFES